MAPKKRLGELLIDAGHLQEQQLKIALAEQRRWGGKLGRVLLDMGAISEVILVHALAKQSGFPIAPVQGLNIPVSVLERIPPEMAEQYTMLPFRVEGPFLDLAMADPGDSGILEEVRLRAGLKVRTYIAGPRELEMAIARHYKRAVPTATQQGRGTAARQPRPQPQPQQRPQPQQPHPMSRANTAPSVPLQRGPGPMGGDVPEHMIAEQTAPIVDLSGSPDPEVAALQGRVQKLEALITRDENVLRKVLGLFVEKRLATREEILERLG